MRLVAVEQPTHLSQTAFVAVAFIVTLPVGISVWQLHLPSSIVMPRHVYIKIYFILLYTTYIILEF